MSTTLAAGGTATWTAVPKLESSSVIVIIAMAVSATSGVCRAQLRKQVNGAGQRPPLGQQRVVELRVTLLARSSRETVAAGRRSSNFVESRNLCAMQGLEGGSAGELTYGGAALVGQLELLFSALARTGTALTDGALTTTQRLALIELVDSGPLRLGALAERIGATDPTASRAMDGLVGAGIVERRADPLDRRAVLHLATAKGQTWVERRRGEVSAALDEALEGLPAADRARLLRLVSRLNDELRATSTRRSPGHPALFASR
jgi:DNA-binding MarR family transcriptional regulator